MVTFFRASQGPCRSPRALRHNNQRKKKPKYDLPHPNRLPGIFGTVEGGVRGMEQFGDEEAIWWKGWADGQEAYEIEEINFTRVILSQIITMPTADARLVRNMNFMSALEIWAGRWVVLLKEWDEWVVCEPFHAYNRYINAMNRQKTLHWLNSALYRRHIQSRRIQSIRQCN